eukprot:CAMPEP_0173217416 /NCGR_PEP_ID=MMETSP1142-20121109/486_1 /TAXON_ID=483371 /ORGANISM="non described non described, Strain CCMP2298" /LENGTH=535 /DNA_ID=CAMNT_0014144999 /DNA_START=91 /DNA_END=1696 /DNA_ORIENTATION=-
MLRGIGDPLVGLYARTYLVVVASNVAPTLTSHATAMLSDTLVTVGGMGHLKDLKSITPEQYHHLLSPGVEWIVRTVGRSASRETFQNVLQLYREFSSDSMVLMHILTFFDGSFYAHAALGMASLIRSATPSSVSLAACYTALGKQMAVHPPPEEQRLPLLNEVWKTASKSTDMPSYVKCCGAWLDLVQKYYSEREMYVLLASLSTRLQEEYDMGGEGGADAVLALLENLISSLIGQSGTFGTAVLTSEHLLRILDLFKGPKRVLLCTDILTSFRLQPPTNDAVLINTLFDLCRTVHDSVDRLSAVTDVTHVASLLGGFVEHVDFGRDLEQQLNFYVECRAVFCNLDQLTDKLVQAAAHLCTRTYIIAKGKHSKKTSTFAKACLAYCHITIPSLACPLRRLELQLLLAQVSLLNVCLPQTDTFLKGAITTLPELPPFTEVSGRRVHCEERLAPLLLNLLSTLVVAPGHPEHGPFYIVQGLLNAIPRFPWSPEGRAQGRVYCGMLSLLCTLAQRRLPYHIKDVQSNDELYSGAEYSR